MGVARVAVGMRDGWVGFVGLSGVSVWDAEFGVVDGCVDVDCKEPDGLEQ